MESPLLKLWNRMVRYPFGRALFNTLIRVRIPYTSTIAPQVLTIQAGFAEVRMRDRRRVRNHLRSVHAIALMNLAEFSTGLAMTSRQTNAQRAILVRLGMTYLKKARGTLTAQCRDDHPPLKRGERTERVLTSCIVDASGDEVARAEATWLLEDRTTDKPDR